MITAVIQVNIYILHYCTVHQNVFIYENLAYKLTQEQINQKPALESELWLVIKPYVPMFSDSCI